MEPLTIHYTFKLAKESGQDEEILNKLKSVPELCHGESVTPVALDCGTNDKLIVASASDGSHSLLHVYENGLVTIDVQRYLSNQNKDRDEASLLPLEFKKIKELELKIRHRLGDSVQLSRSIPMPIRRGEVCPYMARGNDCLMEYEEVSLVYEQNSCWQNIKILHTKEYGNLLSLDDEIMISDSDLVYTNTLMGVDRNDYSGRTVLILGGGDGGLLYELLKFNPKHVLMVEIDEDVIKACRVHLRQVCGDSLDSLEGDRYQIRIENCLTVLKECLVDNRKFDYVINDLTEHMCGTDVGFAYDFKTTSNILEMSMKLLTSEGKYLSRGACSSMVDEIGAFEDDAISLGLKCTTHVVHVPSFREPYSIFEVTNEPGDNTI